MYLYERKKNTIFGFRIFLLNPKSHNITNITHLNNISCALANWQMLIWAASKSITATILQR